MSATRTRGSAVWIGSMVLLALVVAGCGGADTADTSNSGSTDGDTSQRNPGVDVTISADDGEVVVVTSDRPDWLPVWLLLPEGLDIQASAITPGTGEAVITGTVPNSDVDELFDDAVFMAQSGGYIITEQFEAGGKGFTAEHSSDGSTATFTAVQVVDDLHQWAWQFEGFLQAETGDRTARPASGAGDIGLEPLPRRGNLTITVTNPRLFARIDGACDGTNSQVQFASDDGSTKFIVFTGDAVGGAGEVTADFEGENVTWVAAADSEQTAAQTDRTSAYYEGDFIQGDDVVFGVVQIACNE